MSFRIHDYIGFGSYGNVLRAVNTAQGTIVAIKKSRVSLTVKRTLLHYEARVLQLLQGHPAIPCLFAYGRLPHFEYLAIELGGESIKELSPRPQGTQLRTVLIIAEQMISALEHIHSHGIVHRDVKPDHMLVSLQDPLRIIFVDYGISCPLVPVRDMKRYDPESEHRAIVGTVKWASLNAHHGYHLTYRDDFESLAYALLYLLRGNLPWEDIGENDTVFGKMAKVRALKTLWTGSKLAEAYPSAFGQFLDEARALEFGHIPPYAHYRDIFNDVYRRACFAEGAKEFDWSPAAHPIALDARLSPKSTQLIPGQLLSVELLAGPTILGIMPDHILWNSDLIKHWSVDLCYDPLPAVVLGCTTDNEGWHHATFAILKRGDTPQNHTRHIPIGPEGINTTPSWPLSDTHCYVFPEPASFVVVENSAQSIGYHISPSDISVLRSKLEGGDPVKIQDEHDVQILASMKKREATRTQFFKLARVHRLEPMGRVEWSSDRGWFDQIASVTRRRALDDAWPWTGTPEDADDGEAQEWNSYDGIDLADWDDRQHERDASLTLSSLPFDKSLAPLDETLTRITEVVET